ncbi:MAG: cytochrome b/b6 domain-containing protein [Rhodocyclaceae bacterium]|nr:cytochrome b/b6 domain-containing protein [Rhodocyclaceae bacterium]
MNRILVWDLPTRLGHWLLAGAFAVAWLTSEGEAWKNVHVAAGALMAAVVLFRLLWGVIGSRHARFGNFAFGPGAAFAYIKGLLRRNPPHFTGHNPAGSYAIFLLLGLTLAVALSGWVLYNEVGGHFLEEVHELAAELMLVIVGLHLAGVVVGSLLHGENLARAMVTGRKLGAPDEAITGVRWGWAIVLAAVATAAIWYSRYL